MSSMAEWIIWGVSWAVAISIAAYAGYVALRIIGRTTRTLYRYVQMKTAYWINLASNRIALVVIEGGGVVCWAVGLGLKWLFAPLFRGAEKIKAQKEAGQRWNTSDPMKEARDILGLPDQFTATDLKARHRDLIRRVAPDTGGTDWLAAQVNAARDLLKGYAT
jgi:hypothetical protein